MAEPGICPLTICTWRPTGSFGYPKGSRGGNQPRFFVDHIMSGFKTTMDDSHWFDQHPSVHFAIGKDGRVSQYVRIQDASWGNGLTGSVSGDRRGINGYDRSNRHLAALENMPGADWSYRQAEDSFALISGARNLPNSFSISIEHEDENKGGHIRWTLQMYEADLAIKKWCIEEVKSLGLPPMEIDEDLLVGHFQIDCVDRGPCPGSAWPKAQLLEDLLGGADMYHKQDAWPAFFTDGGGLMISGGSTQRINTRVDFEWPPDIKLGEVELLVKTGYVIVKHGDGTQAGRVGFGVRTGDASCAAVRVVPDADGWIELFAEDVNNPVQFFHAHATGYWT